MSVMLYKHPGKHNIHGDKFDYLIVKEDEVEATIKKGWYKTTAEAKENYEVIDVKPEKRKTAQGKKVT